MALSMLVKIQVIGGCAFCCHKADAWVTSYLPLLMVHPLQLWLQTLVLHLSDQLLAGLQGVVLHGLQYSLFPLPCDLLRLGTFNGQGRWCNAKCPLEPYLVLLNPKVQAKTHSNHLLAFTSSASKEAVTL